MKRTAAGSWGKEMLAAGRGLPRSLILKPLKHRSKEQILIFNRRDQKVGRLYSVSSSSTRILWESCNLMDSKSDLFFSFSSIQLRT